MPAALADQKTKTKTKKVEKGEENKKKKKKTLLLLVKGKSRVSLLRSSGVERCTKPDECFKLLDRLGLAFLVQLSTDSYAIARLLGRRTIQPKHIRAATDLGANMKFTSALVSRR